MAERSSKTIRDRSDFEAEIDLLKLFRALWKKVWLIMLVSILFAGAAFAGTEFLITPTYNSQALMYINNTGITIEGNKTSISSSDISASKSLVDSVSIIMTSRPMIESVIEKTGVPYTYEKLVKMVSAEAVNNTEIFKIVVTDANPEEGTLICNTMANELSENISQIVENCSVRIFELAVTPTKSSYPNTKKNTALGFILGFVLVCGIITVRFLLNDVIDGEDDIKEVSEIPVLAAIPELLASRAAAGYYGYGKGGKK